MKIQIESTTLVSLLRNHPRFTEMGDEEFWDMVSLCSALHTAKKNTTGRVFMRLVPHDNKLVDTIKFIRMVAGLGLKEAKEVVDKKSILLFESDAVLGKLKSYENQHGMFAEVSLWYGHIPMEDIVGLVTTPLLNVSTGSVITQDDPKISEYTSS